MLNFFKKLFGFADVNKDGRVDSKDAKVVAQKAEAKVGAAAAKAKEVVKKTTAKAKTTRTKKAAAKPA